MEIQSDHTKMNGLSSMPPFQLERTNGCCLMQN